MASGWAPVREDGREWITSRSTWLPWVGARLVMGRAPSRGRMMRRPQQHAACLTQPEGPIGRTKVLSTQGVAPN